jgi:hypothetical protein
VGTSDPLERGYESDATSISSIPCPDAVAPPESSPIESVLEEVATSSHRPCNNCKDKALYSCTFKKCQFATHYLTDWKRHEETEKHWPQARYMCLECPTSSMSLTTIGPHLCKYCGVMVLQGGEGARQHYLHCQSARQDGTTYVRKDHLTCHLREEHNMIDERAKSTASAGRYTITNTKWPRECGFCGVSFGTWDERMEHIAEHYQNGKTILKWKLPFSTPKDFRPRDNYSRPRDDDDDSGDDDFHGGGGHSHGKIVGSHRTGASKPAKDSRSQSYHGSASSAHLQRGMSHISDSGLNHVDRPLSDWFVGCKVPSLALERYLNDLDEPTIYRPGNHPRFSSGIESDFQPSLSSKLSSVQLEPGTSGCILSTSTLLPQRTTGNQTGFYALRHTVKPESDPDKEVDDYLKYSICLSPKRPIKSERSLLLISYNNCITGLGFSSYPRNVFPVTNFGSKRNSGSTTGNFSTWEWEDLPKVKASRVYNPHLNNMVHWPNSPNLTSGLNSTSDIYSTLELTIPSLGPPRNSYLHIQWTDPWLTPDSASDSVLVGTYYYIPGHSKWPKERIQPHGLTCHQLGSLTISILLKAKLTEVPIIKMDDLMDATLLSNSDFYMTIKLWDSSDVLNKPLSKDSSRGLLLCLMEPKLILATKDSLTGKRSACSRRKFCRSWWLPHLANV